MPETFIDGGSYFIYSMGSGIGDLLGSGMTDTNIASIGNYVGMFQFRLNQLHAATIPVASLQLQAIYQGYPDLVAPIVAALTIDQVWPGSAGAAAAISHTVASSSIVLPGAGGFCSCDVTAIIQELVNQASWVANGRVLFFVGYGMSTSATADISTSGVLTVGSGGGGGGPGPGGQVGANAAFFLELMDDE